MEEKIGFENKISDWWMKWVILILNIWLIEVTTNTKW
jgi:hypothetical protein